MSTHSHYLAIDLGAESGRVMLGTLWEGRLTLEEIHRFSNGAVVIKGSRRWDLGNPCILQVDAKQRADTVATQSNHASNWECSSDDHFCGGVPPAISTIRATARTEATSAPCASTPLSKR